MNSNFAHPAVAEMIERIDQVANAPTIKPPDYGASQRQAISAIADNLTSDLHDKIGKLHKRLDELEQCVLTGTAEAKAKLTETVTVCAGVNDEVDHIADIIEEIARRAALAAAPVRV
jgi:hypothetical protein